MKFHQMRSGRAGGLCLSLVRPWFQKWIVRLLLVAAIVHTAKWFPKQDGRGSQSQASLPNLIHQSRNVCSLHKQSYSIASSRNRRRQCNEDYCFIIVVTVNMGFLDFFTNWYSHYERVVLRSPLRGRVGDDADIPETNHQAVNPAHLPFLAVIAEDKNIYDKLLSLPLSKEDNVAIILGAHATRQFNNSEAARYNSSMYKLIVSDRATHLLNLICGLPEKDQSNKLSSLDEGNRWIVVYSDIDTVWLKDPIPIIQTTLFEAYNASDISSPRQQQLLKYDILASVEQRHTKGYETYYCTGFLVFACTPSSIDFLSRWEKELQLNPQLNQPIFNSLLQTQHSGYTHPRYGELSAVEFPSGKSFFDEKRNRTEVLARTVVVHNNYIVGHDKKKKRFEAYGLWIS